MKFVCSALLACLCLGGFGATSAQATTFTVFYDIEAVLDVEFFQTLYYLDHSDPYGPYVEGCNYGEACYPTDWRPNWYVSDSYQMGDVLTGRIEVIVRESDYYVQSISGGGLAGGFYYSSEGGFFDPNTLDISAYSFGTDDLHEISLKGGTGSIYKISEDFGENFCFSGTPLVSFHPDFCSGTYVEVFFTVTSYTVTSPFPAPAAVPVPASALFLLTAMGGGLLLRARRTTRMAQ